MKLDRTTLKYIAVIAMILDHIGVFLLSTYAPGAAAAGIAAGAGSGIVLGGMPARSSSACDVIAFFLAIALSGPRQRPIWPSGLLMVTGGNRPKLTFMGWKERAPE